MRLIKLLLATAQETRIDVTPHDSQGAWYTHAIWTAIGIIVLVFGFIVWQWRSGSAAPGAASGVPQIFFTDDEGQHWFPDDRRKVPPFDHNGKEAVEAEVYKCDGKTFVNHMKRYTPRNGRTESGGKIIDDDDSFARIGQRVHHVAADIARTAGNEDSHSTDSPIE